MAFMVSFRSAERQAAHALSKANAIGQSRHAAKAAGNQAIHSFGSLRNYTEAVKLAARWYASQGQVGRDGFNGQIKDMTAEQAREYLTLRASEVGQKQLDLDRQALQYVVGERIERHQPYADREDRLATQSRAYSQTQIEAIASRQAPQDALATLIAAAAGLRAHELLTLDRVKDQAASTHREFRDDRFAARTEAFERYTVVGKGGLIREVAIPKELADRLERVRLPEPAGVRDRGIWYRAHYAISGGQKWSQSFTRASRAELGWSAGAHGLRHTFTQDRIEQLQRAGYSWRDAKEVASQELGHFREDVTNAYLR